MIEWWDRPQQQIWDIEIMGPQMVWHFIFCFYFFLIIRERTMTMTTTPHTHYHHDNSNSGDNHKTWWGVRPRKRTERERLLENGVMEARVNGKGRELLSTGGWGRDCDLWWILASPMHWAAYRASKWYYFLIEENFFFWLNSMPFEASTTTNSSRLGPSQAEAVTHGSLDASSVSLNEYANSMHWMEGECQFRG